MSNDNSVTHWIAELQRGNRAAAQKLWERYFDRLVCLAGNKLRGRRLGVADEEDVALSAVKSVFRGIEGGRYPQLSDRDDLWRLLMVITAHKAIRLVRDQSREKRGGNRVILAECNVPEDEEAAIRQVLSREPTPEFTAQVTEQYLRLLDGLKDDKLRQIAISKMEGYSNDEIAANIGCTTRTVERKLHLIRSIWQTSELAD